MFEHDERRTQAGDGGGSRERGLAHGSETGGDAEHAGGEVHRAGGQSADDGANRTQYGNLRVQRVEQVHQSLELVVDAAKAGGPVEHAVDELAHVRSVQSCVDLHAAGTGQVHEVGGSRSGLEVEVHLQLVVVVLEITGLAPRLAHIEIEVRDVFEVLVTSGEMAGCVHAVDGLPVGVLYLLGQVHVTAAKVVQLAFELVRAVRVELDAGFLAVQLVGLAGHVLEVGNDLRVTVDVDANLRARIVFKLFDIAPDAGDGEVGLFHLHDVRTQRFELENRVLQGADTTLRLIQHVDLPVTVLAGERGRLVHRVAVLLHQRLVVLELGGTRIDRTVELLEGTVGCFDPLTQGTQVAQLLGQIDLRGDVTLLDILHGLAQRARIASHLDGLGETVVVDAPFRRRPVRIVHVDVQRNGEIVIRVLGELAAQFETELRGVRVDADANGTALVYCHRRTSFRLSGGEQGLYRIEARLDRFFRLLRVRGKNRRELGVLAVLGFHEPARQRAHMVENAQQEARVLRITVIGEHAP